MNTVRYARKNTRLKQILKYLAIAIYLLGKSLLLFGAGSISAVSVKSQKLRELAIQQ
jgi:hypothetical protein